MAFRTVPWSGRWVALRDSQTTLTLCSSRGRVYNGAERLQPPRNPQFGALEPGSQHPAHGMPGPNCQEELETSKVRITGFSGGWGWSWEPKGLVEIPGFSVSFWGDTSGLPGREQNVAGAAGLCYQKTGFKPSNTAETFVSTMLFSASSTESWRKLGITG